VGACTRDWTEWRGGAVWLVDILLGWGDGAVLDFGAGEVGAGIGMTGREWDQGESSEADSDPDRRSGCSHRRGSHGSAALWLRGSTGRSSNLRRECWWF
jgi:hypothetical protein